MGTEDELVFRFVGYDSLSEVLERIARAMDAVADHATNIIDRLEVMDITLEETKSLMDSVADNTQKVADRMDELILSMDMLALNMLAVRDAVDALSDKMDQLADNETKVARASTAAAGGVGLLGAITFITANPIVSLIAVIVLLGTAISGLLPVVGIWLLMLGPLLVGLAGLGIAGTAALLAIGGLAAGVLYLASSTGQLANSLANVHKGLTAMADALGKQAAPMAQKFLDLLTGETPFIYKMGQEILTWFGQRVPMVISRMEDLIADLMNSFREIGPVVGKFIDYFLQTPAIGSIFDTVIDFMTDTIKGLLNNLLALAQWFVVRFPAIMAIMGPGFSLLGSFVQFVAKEFGKLTDWLISVWPAAVAYTRASINELRKDWELLVQGFQWASVIFKILPPIFNGLGIVLQFVKQHLEEARVAFFALGVVFALVAMSLAMTAAFFLAIVALVGLLVIGIIALVDWVRGKAVPAIGQFFSAVGAFIHNGITALTNFFAWLVASAESYWSQFTQRPLYWIGFLIGFIIGKLFEIQLTVDKWFINLVSSASNGFSNFVRTATAKLGLLPGEMQKVFTEALLAVIVFIDNGLHTIASNMPKWADAIRNELNKLPGQVESIGRSIVTGLINGINSLAGWAASQAQNFVSGIVAGMKAAIGAGSPSRMAAQEVGVPISQGLAVGMQTEQARTQNAMSSLVVGLIGGTASSVRTALPNLTATQNANIVLQLDSQVMAKATQRQINRYRGRMWT